VVLHKTGLWTRIKRTVFGFGKTPFMMAFVMSWWCYDYYAVLLDTPAIQVYLSNLSLNPWSEHKQSAGGCDLFFLTDCL